MKFFSLALAFAPLFIATPALAQTPQPRAHDMRDDSRPDRRQPGIRVNNSLNYFVPGPAGDSAEAEALRQKTREAFYERAARECEILKKIMARECRIEAVNIAINAPRQMVQNANMPEGFTVNGTLVFSIVPK